MIRYAFKTPSIVNTKKVLKKFSESIPVSNQYIRGVFTVTNYRKYSFREEVDVQFDGEIFVTWQRKKDWYDSSIMTKSDGKYKVSVIKVNRFIRRNIIWNVTSHLKYFSVDLKCYSDIKKIKWL